MAFDMNQMMQNPSMAMGLAAARNLGNPYGQQQDPMEAYRRSVMQRATLQQQDRSHQMRQQQAQRQNEMMKLRQQQEARAQATFDKTSETRPIIKGADGYSYYQDTGERVLPGVEAPADKLSSLKERVLMGMQSHGLDPQDPMSIQDPRIQELISSSGGGVDVNVHPSNPLGDATGFDSKKAQSAFRDTLTGLPGILQLQKDFNPEFFTTLGQIGQNVNERIDRVNPEALDGAEKQALTEYTQYSNRVKQSFNAYRKLITGAAASVQEMELLKESMFNMDQGPTAFLASLNTRTEDMARDIRGAIYLQATGQAEIGTPGMEKALNKRPGAAFTGDRYKEEVFNYVASSMGYDPEQLAADQASEVAQYLKSLGFKGR